MTPNISCDTYKHIKQIADKMSNEKKLDQQVLIVQSDRVVENTIRNVLYDHWQECDKCYFKHTSKAENVRLPIVSMDGPNSEIKSYPLPIDAGATKRVALITMGDAVDAIKNSFKITDENKRQRTILHNLGIVVTRMYDIMMEQEKDIEKGDKDTI